MDLTRISATNLLKQLASRQVSASDVMQATLDRIAKVNREVNAIVALRDESDLMAEAQACDNSPVTGPLHGLPIAVKDLVNVAGVVSSQGSPMFKGFVPDTDDLIATRMRAAGAILIGKTNTPEFGLGSHTFNPVYGATRNPYDADFTCGGSSGGAAVALATGMVALADGSDMMGSLRNPAGWNSVLRLSSKLGQGCLPIPWATVFLHQLSTLGPMARCPEDLGVLLDVISGPDPRLPLAAKSAPVSPVTAVDLQGLRIGWLGDWGGAFPTEPGILDICKDAMDVFETLGARVEDIAPPFDAEKLWTSWITLRSFSVAAGLEPLASQKEH